MQYRIQLAGSPSSTDISRHVGKVENDESVIIRLVAREPDTGTTTRLGVVVVDAHVGIGGTSMDEFLVRCVLIGLVLYETVRGICRVPEGELTEEIIAGKVIVFQDVLGPTSGAQHYDARKECGEMHGCILRNDCA